MPKAIPAKAVKKATRVSGGQLLSIGEFLMAVSRGSGNMLAAVQVGYLKRILAPLIEPIQEELQKLVDKHSVKQKGEIVEGPRPGSRKMKQVPQFMKAQEKLLSATFELPKVRPLDFSDIEEMDDVRVTEFQVRAMKEAGLLTGVPEEFDDPAETVEG